MGPKIIPFVVYKLTLPNDFYATSLCKQDTAREVTTKYKAGANLGSFL